MHVLHEELTDEYHENQRRQNQSKRSRDTTQYSHAITHSCMLHSRIAAISGRIDADRSGGHLTHSHNICKLCSSHPVPMVHYLTLYEGKHTITSAKSEETDHEKGDKEMQEYHDSVGLMKRP